jgi:hypothetical protein
MFSRISRIPSVLLLIATGIGMQYLAVYFHIIVPPTGNYLEILGTVGLILIVLEGSLDLKLTKERMPLLLRSLATAFFSLAISAAVITSLLHYIIGVPWHAAIINSIPFSVISSSIAIPSVIHLAKAKKEFIVYESTFSDIIGIMVFNFMISERNIGVEAFANFGISLMAIIGISIVSCLMLLFFIERINLHVKFFLVFAVLIAVYTVGKMLNLSSLLLILAFGMAIKNSERVLRGKLARWFNTGKLDSELEQLHLVTAESAFLVRTFFFILFGFSFQLQMLQGSQTWISGLIIVVLLMIVRLINLKVFARGSLLPELLIAPRGLVTILLFFSIPETYRLPEFNEGILFFVVIITSILMMFGLAFTSQAKKPAEPTA